MCFEHLCCCRSGYFVRRKTCPYGCSRTVVGSLLTITPFIIALAFCSYFFILWKRSDDWDGQINNIYIGDYDNCGVGWINADERFDTKWTTIYKLNGAVYLLLCLVTCCTCMGLAYAPFLICYYGHCCGIVLHFCVLIVTGTYRYSDEGEACAENEFQYDSEGHTFADDADLITSLFISQIVMFIVFYTCACTTFCILKDRGLCFWH